MQFAYSPLAWGFLLVLVPLLIHLINLVRHKRTPWAAMEFLLESYRKNRRWVWLKQALLIASRMLAMALLVGMLAQWLTDSKMFAWMGRTSVHHYVILDDSASMHDSANNKSAYQNGLAAIASIASVSKQDSQNHLLTVFRASKVQLAASAKSNAEIRADSVAELLAQTIPTDPSGILTKINSTQPTSIEASVLDSLDVVSRLIKSSEDQKSIVYLLSDYRSKDWGNPVTIRQRLQAIQGESVEIQLVDCVEARHENLTITSIEPRQEVLAAGVPTMVNVTVRNQGTTAARNVSVRVTAVDYSSADADPKPSDRFSGVVTELPPLLFERIEPGESTTRNVQVVFPKSGSHVVQAELPPDAIGPDNQASCVLDIAEGIRVLLIDGDVFLDLIVDLAQVQGGFVGGLKVSLLFELCVAGRLGLSLDNTLEPLIDRLDGVSNRIEDPSSGPHGADGWLVQLAEPVGFAQSAAILGLGAEVTELAVLEHQNKNRAVGLVRHRVDQLAELGLIAKPHS